jgi:acetyl-CoA C-acetyltransferase
MVANNSVDAASALFVCSESLAERLGLARSQRVYPHTVVVAHETWRVLERRDLHRCPALEAAAALAFDRSEIDLAAVTEFDLYACFPSIVQIAAEVFNLDVEPPVEDPPTVTGGLALAGAAIANAVGHSLAALVPKLRSGGVGLIHGNGGAATVHSVGLYSAEAPAAGCQLADAQPQAQLAPRTVLDPQWSGPVEIEAATFTINRDATTEVVAVVVNEDGHRAFARSSDPALVTRVETTGLAGAVGRRSPDGRLTI